MARAINAPTLAPDGLEAIAELQRHMLMKEKADLKNAIIQFEVAQWTLALAPVTLVAGVAGGALVLSTTGLSATASAIGLTSLQASTLVSLSSMAMFAGALSAYNIHKGVQASREHGVEYSWTNVGDDIVKAFVVSPPIAAVAPSLFFGTVYTVPAMATAGKGWIMSSAAFIRSVPSLGIRGLGAKSADLVKWWISSWKNPKQWLVWGALNTTVIGFELLSRSQNDDPNEQVWVPSADGGFKINSTMSVTIGQVLLANTIGAPIAFVDGIGNRMLSGVALAVVSTAIATMSSNYAVADEIAIDSERVAATASYETAAGLFVFYEAGRWLKLRPALLARAGARMPHMAAIGLAYISIDSALVFAETPVRNWWLTYFLEDGQSPLDEKGEYLPGKAPTAQELDLLRTSFFRDYLKVFNFDESEISDSELLEALRMVHADVESGNLPDLSAVVPGAELAPEFLESIRRPQG